ncbi:hypothetical protein ACWAUC_12180 [Bradyrhizobium guangdongense]
MNKPKQVVFKSRQERMATKIEQRLSELDYMLRHLTGEESSEQTQQTPAAEMAPYRKKAESSARSGRS